MAASPWQDAQYAEYIENPESAGVDLIATCLILTGLLPALAAFAPLLFCAEESIAIEKAAKAAVPINNGRLADLLNLR